MRAPSEKKRQPKKTRASEKKQQPKKTRANEKKQQPRANEKKTAAKKRDNYVPYYLAKYCMKQKNSKTNSIFKILFIFYLYCHNPIFKTEGTPVCG